MLSSTIARGHRAAGRNRRRAAGAENRVREIYAVERARSHPARGSQAAHGSREPRWEEPASENTLLITAVAFG